MVIKGNFFVLTFVLLGIIILAGIQVIGAQAITGYASSMPTNVSVFIQPSLPLVHIIEL
jgi:hypothetical protein